MTSEEVLEAQELGGRVLQALARQKSKKVSALQVLHDQVGQQARCIDLH